MIKKEKNWKIINKWSILIHTKHYSQNKNHSRYKILLWSKQILSIFVNKWLVNIFINI